MYRLILGLLLLTLALPGLAQEPAEDGENVEPDVRRYSVELIVFAYAEDVATGSELFLPKIVEVEPSVLPDDDRDLWPFEGPLPDDSMATEDHASSDTADGVIRTGNPRYVNEDGEPVNALGERLDEKTQVIVKAPHALEFFSDDQLTMLDTFDRLDRLDAYRPLLHFGWAQAVGPEEDSAPVTLADLEPVVEGLDGAFTLYLSRYLHLVVDLELLAAVDHDRNRLASNDPRPLTYEQTVAFYAANNAARTDMTDEGETGFDEQAIQPQTMLMALPLKYSISENRIVNSGDVRYFDHPKFGVIAKIERVELPEEPEDPAVPDDTDVLLPVGNQ